MAGLIQPVTIAGGGLAGLSLGIALLRRGVDVTLHEAGRYPRHRVCGEFISGVKKTTLEKLGIADCLRDATPLSSSRWFDASGPVGDIPVEGLGLSRWELDERLRNTFTQAGGNLQTGSRISSPDGVVWAAGRVKTDGQWIGVKCHAHGLPLEADLEMHIASNGYVGLARVESGIVNVCGLFRRQKGIGGRDVLFQCLRAGGLGELAERIQRAAPDPDSFCAVAGFETGRQAGPTFSIGDAAHMIPPFTGNGMTMAFESAECALDPVLEYAAGKITWQEAADESRLAQQRRFSKRMRTAGLLHSLILRWPGLVSAFARQRWIPTGLLLAMLRR
jgi:2-polyprenyl-6-methoxyphenol hydroxylase-like FAD-dependent oxidoreductase